MPNCSATFRAILIRGDDAGLIDREGVQLEALVAGNGRGRGGIEPSG